MNTDYAKFIQRELPSGWRWVKLKEVCEQQTGYRDPRIEPETTFRYVDISSVSNVQKHITEEQIILGKDAPSRARQVIHVNDVIVATTRPNLNAVAIIPPELDNQICSTGFCVLRANHQITPDYLFAVVRSRSFIDSLTNLVKGALYPAVTDSQVKSQIIPLPPLPEQRRIATELREQMVGVEKARLASLSRLEAIRSLPASFLRQIFPQPCQPLPDGWRHVRLGEVCQFIGGSQPPKSNFKYQPTVGYVRLVQIQDFRRSDAAVFIPETMASRMFNETDVMIGRYGPPVFQILRGLSGAYNVALIKTNPSEHLNKDFLYFLLQWPEIQRDVIGQSQRSAGQSGVQKEYLEKYEIPLPDIHQQRRIAIQLYNLMTATEKSRVAAEEELNAINTLPSTLLQKTLYG
jgi:type I restriction enzyme S subunit